MSQAKYLKSELLKWYKEIRNIDTIEDEHSKSIAWYHIYENCYNDLDRTQNVDKIDALKFIIRYSVRQMQLLKQDIHAHIVSEHYYRIGIEKVALLAAKNPALITRALQAKINLNTKNYYWACENIISCEIGNAGYNLNDAAVVGLWGIYPGKWELIHNADKEYYNLSIWNSLPADGAIEIIPENTLGIVDLTLHESGVGAKKVRGTKKEYITPRIAFRIG